MDNAPAEQLATLQALIASDHARMRVLRLVKDLALADCWVAAGFVRSAVWDYQHRLDISPLPDDIDVVWYDKESTASERDTALEAALRLQDESLAWSVKNQARMHLRNDDSPYRSATDAMRHWPETATAVAVRLGQQDVVEVAAPFGLDDLFNLIVRPTPRFMTDKRSIYLDRVRAKDWQATWPKLRIDTPH